MASAGRAMREEVRFTRSLQLLVHEYSRANDVDINCNFPNTLINKNSRRIYGHPNVLTNVVNGVLPLNDHHVENKTRVIETDTSCWVP